MKVARPSVHGDKLNALLQNGKLPNTEVSRVNRAREHYEEWRAGLETSELVGADLLAEMVTNLNAYKRHVELDLIFNSPADFLYRQKGQLKLDNTVLEEFLPFLFDLRLVPGLARLNNAHCGPHSSYAGISFGSPYVALNKGGVVPKKKDQDFSVARMHTIIVTDGKPDDKDAFKQQFAVSHFATEIKTNLDKTMFQEASQTSSELKQAVPGSRYILLCEYLDMRPITTKLTSIDEVIVLRKAKRLGSGIREAFGAAEGRKNARDVYTAFLDKNPIRIECVERFLWHLNDAFPAAADDGEDVVLGRGYF